MAPFDDGLVIGRFWTRRAARRAVAATFAPADELAPGRMRVAGWPVHGVQPFGPVHRELASVAAFRLAAAR